MNYEELMEKFRIDDICPEIDNELNGMFIDILGEDFEIGIFPEPSPSNEDAFVVTVEINCEGASLNAGEINQIKSSVEERLAHSLDKDWKVVQKKFDGVQLILNEDLLS